MRRLLVLAMVGCAGRSPLVGEHQTIIDFKDGWKERASVLPMHIEMHPDVPPDLAPDALAVGPRAEGYRLHCMDGVKPRFVLSGDGGAHVFCGGVR